jgi:hypothetical protein
MAGCAKRTSPIFSGEVWRNLEINLGKLSKKMFVPPFSLSGQQSKQQQQHNKKHDFSLDISEDAEVSSDSSTSSQTVFQEILAAV